MVQPSQEIARAWETILANLGYDRSDPHLRDTPERVARFMREWHTSEVEPPKLTCFPNGKEGDLVNPRIQGMLVTDRLPFYSLCSHHGLPFVGEAVVGYIPGDDVLGLSKFARVVDHFAHRFQVQERLTEQVANHLVAELKPIGLGVVTTATHFCLAMRGANKPGHRTTYSALRGLLFDDSRTRAEFMSLATRE